MAVIGLVVREHVQAAVTKGHSLLNWCKANHHDIVVEENAARVLGVSGGVPAMDVINQADPIVTLGGDGTLIGIARYVKERSPVMIGVNFGTLGFLTEITPAQLVQVLNDFFAGKARYGIRNMLSAEVIRNGEVFLPSQAINDVVIQKATIAPLVDLDISVDAEPVMRLRADGVIIATPTGSTAYSMAAGGSIAVPSLAVMLVTPICPHSLTSRPLILPQESVVEVKIPQTAGQVFLTIDGQESCALEQGDRVRVARSLNTVKFVRSPSKTYFEILRTKLNWGLGNESR